ncbi:MAG: restriction endonuclease subunit S [Bacteroidales bacterium]|jgi:type I restriction enzyme S subunit|nr:restriction endonuclease subunit S [Bacteroidales bacterium]
MKENRNKIANVPNLRFPEFEEEWKEKALGCILKVGNGKDYRHLGEGYIPVFGTGGYMTSVNDYLYDGESVCIGRKGTINKPFYFNGKFWSVDTLFYTHSYKNVFPKFLFYIFEQINWLKYNEASGVPSLSKTTIESIEVSIPPIPEQTKIATFLSLLDDRISTQRQIIEELKSLMKGLNNLIFEKTKTNAKQVFFSELYTIAKEGGTPDTKKAEYYENGKIPFIKIDDLKNKYLENNQWFITEKGLKSSSAWIVPANSIIYSNGATIGSISINKYPVTTKQGILGIVVKDNVSLEYVFYFMSSEYFRREICKITTHGTMKTAYIKDIDTIKCYIPEYEKQINIVKILNVLTIKVEVEQKLLSEYQKQKKYLLNQLFV